MYTKSKDGSSSYNELAMMYAITCLFSSIQFSLYGKRMVIDTHTWYTKRQYSKISVLNKEEAAQNSGMDPQKIPFLHYEPGEGEGVRNLGT